MCEMVWGVCLLRPVCWCLVGCGIVVVLYLYEYRALRFLMVGGLFYVWVTVMVCAVYVSRMSLAYCLLSLLLLVYVVRYLLVDLCLV